ncbi:MAG: hydrogenase large subunit [Actinomycetota bacterium]|nr:hydrogenase large subunit [Actinomycetota bacterium]
MKVVVDPVTRIEGHLRLQAQVDGGKVTDVWSTSPMYRGIEQVLIGRDPRDAWVFTQRICGVCTTVSALASVRAVENALGITVPDNARLMRNLMGAAQLIHDHVVHFYHLHGPDWFDVTSAATADPAKAAALQASSSSWSKNTTEYFTSVRDRLTKFVQSGQLGLFAGGYWGHPAYRLPPEGNLMLVAHYLEALEWQRDAARIHALLGGKNPHPQTYLVGGMSTPLDPAETSSVGPEILKELRAINARVLAFVRDVYVPDLLYLARSYPEYATSGAGTGNLMSYGEFPDATGAMLVPSGIVQRKRPDALERVDQKKITEHVARSWYSGSTARHPSEGVTEPAYTGPTPPYKEIDTSGRYSWSKAPRYEDTVMEVGPLARVMAARAAGVKRVVQLVDNALPALGGKADRLYSTMGRMTARALETQWLTEQLDGWVKELEANITAGKLQIADTTKWDPSTWPATAVGHGTTEAPRGALGHWIRIADGKIAGYQIVIPSTWNGSPRDAKGRRGAWEEALVGTAVHDPAQPVEILRVVHSFDPCMACAVHVLDGEGQIVSELTVVP